MTVRIANGAGFLGDNLDAPRRLVEGAEIDYLTLEYLAELTLSILARLREKDPAAGYAADFITVLSSLCPALARQPKLRIVTNAGGMNPRACANAAAAVLQRAGLGDTTIGVVEGDDLLDRLDEIQAAGCRLENLETGQPLSELKTQVVSANAYLGARPIADALAAGARIVITGRVADASLTVGPAVHEFGWAWDDWNRLAGASVAGHLIECGAQATGGLYRHWQNLNLANVGYPIAELEADGTATITKPPGTGGAVNRHTIAEQLVYEIGDPAHYLTPDVDVDFTTVEISETGHDRVSSERCNSAARRRHAQALARLSSRLRGQRTVARLRSRLHFQGPGVRTNDLRSRCGGRVSARGFAHRMSGCGRRRSGLASSARPDCEKLSCGSPSATHGARRSNDSRRSSPR